jgi:hypothetical protein
MTCTANPPGLSIHYLVGEGTRDQQRITLKGFGFVPREKVILTIEGTGATTSSMLTTNDYPINNDGSFSDDETLQLDDPAMQWKVYVIHQRGTACLSFATQR